MQQREHLVMCLAGQTAMSLSVAAAGGDGAFVGMHAVVALWLSSF